MQLPDPTKGNSKSSPPSAQSRAKKAMADFKAKAAAKLANTRKKAKDNQKNLVRTAHSGGHVATTMAVGNALAYAEGRYGPDYTEVGGMDLRTGVGLGLVATGLIAEAVYPEHADSAGYVTAVGLAGALAGTMSKSRRAGEKARSEVAAKESGQQNAQSAPSGQGDAASKLVEEVKSSRPAVGGSGRHKREIRPPRDEPGIPPHLAKFLKARAAA